jgi:hypothetical protein
MVDEDGNTPLDIATRNYENAPVIGLLLTCGAEPVPKALEIKSSHWWRMA